MNVNRAASEAFIQLAFTETFVSRLLLLDCVASQFAILIQ